MGSDSVILRRREKLNRIKNMSTIKQSTLGLTSQDKILGYVAGRQGAKEIGIAHVATHLNGEMLVQVVDGQWQILPPAKQPMGEAFAGMSACVMGLPDAVRFV